MSSYVDRDLDKLVREIQVAINAGPDRGPVRLLWHVSLRRCADGYMLVAHRRVELHDAQVDLSAPTARALAILIQAFTLGRDLQHADAQTRSAAA